MCSTTLFHNAACLQNWRESLTSAVTRTSVKPESRQCRIVHLKCSGRRRSPYPRSEIAPSKADSRVVLASAIAVLQSRSSCGSCSDTQSSQARSNLKARCGHTIQGALRKHCNTSTPQLNMNTAESSAGSWLRACEPADRTLQSQSMPIDSTGSLSAH